MLDHVTVHATKRIKERTQLDKDDLKSILKRKKYINLGSKPGILKRHLLFYSVKDDNYFVILEDIIDGTVITVLPEEYQNNLAMKVTEEDKQKAKILSLAPELAEENYCKFIVTAIYRTKDNHDKAKDLFKFKALDKPALTKKYFIDNYIKTGKCLETYISKGLEVKDLDGFSIKDSVTYRFFIEHDHSKPKGN